MATQHAPLQFVVMVARQFAVGRHYGLIG